MNLLSLRVWSVFLSLQSRLYVYESLRSDMVEAILVYCSHSIVAQAVSAHVAGYETTSTAISYALYELARNPQVQQKLQAEVDGFGRERQPSYDDLSSFPYAEAVFSEGMRLHPPVTPFIALVLLHPPSCPALIHCPSTCPSACPSICPSTCPAIAVVPGRAHDGAWQNPGR